MKSIATITTYDEDDMEKASSLVEEYSLHPADSIRVTLALKEGIIVRSDKAYKRVRGLQQKDFTKLA